MCAHEQVEALVDRRVVQVAAWSRSAVSTHTETQSRLRTSPGQDNAQLLQGDSQVCSAMDAFVDKRLDCATSSSHSTMGQSVSRGWGTLKAREAYSDLPRRCARECCRGTPARRVPLQLVALPSTRQEFLHRLQRPECTESPQ